MGRKAGYSKKDYNYRMDSYIEGNVVRVPEREENIPRRKEKARPSVSKKTSRNREKALQLNLKYVFFLFIAAAVTVFVCVGYLQPQADNTAYRKRIAALESQISTLKMENEAAYEKAAASVDLDEVKNIAIKKFGMIYANQGQIITYDVQDSDYVRQYDDVPIE